MPTFDDAVIEMLDALAAPRRAILGVAAIREALGLSRRAAEGTATDLAVADKADHTEGKRR